ncbi:NAD(P)-dependent oxidoreductase [Streptomyces cocklensis]|uniref:UDP-glucose 4-epimerase n=1 Tax=Actinacidiphila cocklensis TaxID=887465 RepID=A0A9W4DIU9_9ACTN|nr:NAD(P)-dependent oxidoreductase [Actinacidiphila cocklensis]MDD1058724.1 NAD(P)-dependent oxidoreductase [Actinacidiphila cocklensis]WSX75071.1 NAD(P)-dependent oxidoreductase [Streptomyces sp. NBC_00899]CAG6390917.1 UDP-glucose 4-epimerase [Actinacidiphila cocklensis]
MKVLVTGAGGTLGREVVAHLRGEGWTVRAHDRTPADPSAADEVLTGELRDAGVLARAVDAVDAVVHAAALPSPTAAAEDEVFLNNVTASHLVLAGAARAGAGRLVNVSSLSALGFAFSRHDLSPRSVPVTEDQTFTGDDVYGLSKYVGEEIAARVSSRWGATAVSLRFPFLGTGDRLRRHLERVHADPRVDRGSLWGWLDTRDAARAIGLALTAPLDGHTVVNVAAPDTTALVPTADLVRRYHPGTRFDAPLEGFAVPFATRRSQELLGFATRHAWRPRN